MDLDHALLSLIANLESDSIGETEKVETPKKLKSYTAEFKLKVIQCAKETSNNAASKKFGLARSNVIDWIKQENQLRQFKDLSPGGKFKKKLPGGGRPLTFKDLDNKLAAWVRECRSKKLRISHSILQQKAVEMFNPENDEDGFKGSRGWVIKFLARHNFCIRDPT